MIWSETSQNISELEKQCSVIQNSLNIKSISITALSAAILQIAKQGISLVHQGLQDCPDGRGIGSEKLKHIVWQARNQSMHYEEGKFSQSVRSCFLGLEHSFDDRFSLSVNGRKNLAYDVIDILNWKEYPQYESDLEHLLRVI